MREKLIAYKDWFETYVTTTIEASSREALNFELKREHTHRVMDNMRMLAEIKNLSEHETYLCEIIGLFHDLGRFKQYENFGTFKDDVTGSHGTIGVDLLKELEVLSALTDKEKNLVYKAIEYHNHLTVPENEDDEVTLYSHLIRDADKLDAYYLHTLENGRMYKLEDYSNEKPYSNEIVEAIMKSRQADFRDIKYTHDLNLAIVALLFNIQMDASFEIIKRNDYMQRMFNQFPKDETMLKALNHCKDYVDKRLNKTYKQTS